MNWYILFVFSNRAKKIRDLLISNNIESFIPLYEYYHRSTKSLQLKPLFPNYLFVKTRMEIGEFYDFLRTLSEKSNSLIKLLDKPDVSAMKQTEIQMLEHLMDPAYIVRMSIAYLENRKAIIVKGPLKFFQDNIVKVDKHDRVAYLDLVFMEHRIKLGLQLIRRE